MVKSALCDSFVKVPPEGVARQEGGGDRGKIEWKSSEANTRTVSGGQNELIDEFKMPSGDVISIRGQGMEYT